MKNKSWSGAWEWRVVQEQKWPFFMIFHLDLQQITSPLFSTDNWCQFESNPHRTSNRWSNWSRRFTIRSLRRFSGMLSQKSGDYSGSWIFANYLIDVARRALCRIPHLTGFLQNYTIKESSASSYPLFLAKKDNPSREKNHYWCRCIKEPSFPLKILRSCWLMIFSSCWAVTPPEWRWKGYFVKINFKKVSFDHAITISFAFNVL